MRKLDKAFLKEAIETGKGFLFFYPEDRKYLDDICKCWLERYLRWLGVYAFGSIYAILYAITLWLENDDVSSIKNIKKIRLGFIC